MEKTKKQPTLWGNVKALFFGVLVALLLVEIVLRIFQPFPFRIKHGKIILPANQQIIHKNPAGSKLEPVVYYTRNSLGMRGAELPKQPEQYTKIITIGGSTTECSYNSDSLTWPELLKTKLQQRGINNLWLNNAGLDGTSTFGHLLLLQEHILSLKPDYIIFLTGVNDMEETAMGGFDAYHSNEWNTSSAKGLFRSLLQKTETGALVENIYRYRIARKKGMTHRVVDYATQPKLILTEAQMQAEANKQSHYLGAYRARILKLDSICKANGIVPVFLTQPSLYASFTDPATGIDFTNLQTATGRNAQLQGMILSRYNDVLLQLSKEQRIRLIDLATAMHKNSAYYYDYSHYTSTGTKVVAQIVADSMVSILR
jgi:lysophospholipase L1-like esterase